MNLKIFVKGLRRLRLLRNGMQLNRSKILDISCKFVVNECIEGDYYEFGVWRGQTFIYAYLRLIQTAKKRLKNSSSIGINLNADIKRRNILESTIFHAFDSFEGLPELTLEDKYSDDFFKGQFSAGTEVLNALMRKFNVPENRVRIHKGWFSENCNYDYSKKKNLKKASIVWLDCDLYSSAKDCFNLITHLIQDGTVLIIDDWFSNKGSPIHGVQKAFYEWSKKEHISSEWTFVEYQKESWKRISFIINSR